jgi:hypothetical protein
MVTAAQRKSSPKRPFNPNPIMDQAVINAGFGTPSDIDAAMPLLQQSLQIASI